MSLNFAPYSSPPGSPSSKTRPLASSSNATPASKWFSPSSSQPQATPSSSAAPYNPNSYQSGATISSLAGNARGGGGGGGAAIWNYDEESAGQDVGTSTRSGGGGAGGGFGNAGPGRTDAYETRFGTRLDLESAFAYVFGPFSAILLLILETKNDHVRFHAWQSLLLAFFLVLFHLLVIWSSFLSWVLFLFDLGIYGFMAWMAYRDANSLGRVALPHIGMLAEEWVEQE